MSVAQQKGCHDGCVDVKCLRPLASLDALVFSAKKSVTHSATGYTAFLLYVYKWISFWLAARDAKSGK